MKNRGLRAGVVAGVLAAVVCGCGGGRPSSMSAEMRISQGGQSLDAMKFYLSGQKMRTESSMLGGMVTIVRKDRNVVWMLLPQSKQYMEKPLDAKQASQDPTGDPPGTIKKEKIGRETLDGFACTKYKITVQHPTTKQPMVTTSWHCDRLGMAIRSESMGTTTEFRNIKTGGQPRELFEIPEGYQKTDSPLGFMLGLGGQAGTGDAKAKEPRGTRRPRR